MTGIVEGPFQRIVALPQDGAGSRRYYPAHVTGGLYSYSGGNPTGRLIELWKSAWVNRYPEESVTINGPYPTPTQSNPGLTAVDVQETYRYTASISQGTVDYYAETWHRARYQEYGHTTRPANFISRATPAFVNGVFQFYRNERGRLAVYERPVGVSGGFPVSEFHSRLSVNVPEDTAGIAGWRSRTLYLDIPPGVNPPPEVDVTWCRINWSILSDEVQASFSMSPVSEIVYLEATQVVRVYQVPWGSGRGEVLQQSIDKDTLGSIAGTLWSSLNPKAENKGWYSVGGPFGRNVRAGTELSQPQPVIQPGSGARQGNGYLDISNPPALSMYAPRISQSRELPAPLGRARGAWVQTVWLQSNGGSAAWDLRLSTGVVAYAMTLPPEHRQRVTLTGPLPTLLDTGLVGFYAAPSQFAAVANAVMAPAAGRTDTLQVKPEWQARKLRPLRYSVRVGTDGAVQVHGDFTYLDASGASQRLTGLLLFDVPAAGTPSGLVARAGNPAGQYEAGNTFNYVPVGGEARAFEYTPSVGRTQSWLDEVVRDIVLS